MNELFVLSNSPGEVAGWLGPAAAAVHAADADIAITAVTLPCPYASGMEARCAAGLPGVRGSLPLRGALSLRASAGAEPGRRLILQLGGDPMYGYALSVRMKAPWMIYTARPKFRGRVTHYFLPDENARRRFEKAGVETPRYSVAGSLILDSVPETTGTLTPELRGLCGDKKLITFMPGSRPFEYELGFGFFSECARQLHEEFPGWQAIMPVAPTVDEAVMRRGLSKMGFSWDENGAGRICRVRLDGDYGVPLIRSGQYDAIAASSLAAAFPGTNNLQIAFIGVPLFMAAPLNEAQNIPLDGIAGALPQRSKMIRGLKKRLVIWANAREAFVSLPNRMAGERVLPERRELMTPESTCRYLAELMASPEKRQAIKDGYAKLGLRRGAAQRVAARVTEYFHS